MGKKISELIKEKLPDITIFEEGTLVGKWILDNRRIFILEIEKDCMINSGTDAGAIKDAMDFIIGIQSDPDIKRLSINLVKRLGLVQFYEANSTILYQNKKHYALFIFHVTVEINSNGHILTVVHIDIGSEKTEIG